MDNKYNEIMNNIEVTPEMRNRILNNISNADVTSKSKAKVTRMPLYVKNIIGVAAALLVVGSVVLYIFNNSNFGMNKSDAQAENIGLQIKDEYAADELEDAAFDGEISKEEVDLNQQGFTSNARDEKFDIAIKSFIYCDESGVWYKICDSAKASEALNILSSNSYTPISEPQADNWKSFILITNNQTYYVTMSDYYYCIDGDYYKFDSEENLTDKLVKFVMENGNESEPDLEECHP